MPVFISYAEEDSASAEELANELAARSIHAVYYEDAKQRGGHIVEKLSNNIKSASVFLVLLSEHYLQSTWCEFEFEVAFLLEIDARTKKKPFEIQVLKVGDVEKDNLVFQRIYDWVDKKNRRAYTSFLDRLKAKEAEQQMSKATEKDKPEDDWIPFTNREEELRYLIRSLENPSGEHFHVIVAPPQMGKSWLVQQTAINLLKENVDWLTQSAALVSDQGARSNLFLLLKALNFVLPKKLLEADPLTSEDLSEAVTEVALQIMDSKRPRLLLLDNAELLDSRTAKQLRSLLSSVRQAIEISPAARLGLIAASRIEIKEFTTYLPRPAFVQMFLTEFKENVITELIDKITKDENINIPGGDYSRDLLKATEGLPALISMYLSWMQKKRFLRAVMQTLSRSSLFREIAGEYIKNELLAADVLIPQWPEPKTQEQARKFWENLVLRSSVFRLITRLHIRALAPDKRSTSALIGSQDLMDGLGKLSIVIPIETIWYRMYPSIRRLLFRYFFPDPKQQAEQHRKSEQLYATWINDLSGTDRIVFLVERIWHHTEYMRLTREENKSSDPLQSTEDFIQDLCKQERQHTNGLSYSDFVKGLRRSIESDKELPTSLIQIHEDLLERVIDCLNKIK
jgi:hypothetical protein